MKQKKWYCKKRFWFLIILLIYLGAIQMEWAKNRYSPQTVVKQVQSNTNFPTKIDSKRIDGQTITYLKVGNNPNLPLLVLVHGSPGSLTAYEDYYTDPALLEKFTIISVDRLGFGYSDFGKSEPDLANHAKLIGAILADYPTQKKLLVGHSMGGPVIAKTAMDFPQLVDGLILIAPSISPQLEPSNRWRKILNWWPISVLTPDALRICNQEIIPLKTELTNILDEWKNITVPVKVIQGVKDFLVPPGNADFAKEMLVNSPSVDIQKIKDGNHFILWNRNTLIKKEILGFF